MESRSLIYAFFLTIVTGTAYPSVPVSADDESGTLYVAEHTVGVASRLTALGWQPAIALEAGISSTYSWFVENWARISD
jgi:nucleoside-diphosphate-sugar epimerase